jgi:AMP deaminase
MTLDDMATGSVSPRILCNEISAPYEVPQFPIEQLEKKLAIQRQLSSRYRDISCLVC